MASFSSLTLIKSRIKLSQLSIRGQGSALARCRGCSVLFSTKLMMTLMTRAAFTQHLTRPFAFSCLPRGFTKFTQLHVVTSQFVMFIPCALRARIEDGTGSRHTTRRSSVKVPCEVIFHLQLAIVLLVVVLYLQ